MEFLATILVILAIVIAVVTVVGHGIWMFFSCVFLGRRAGAWKAVERQVASRSCFLDRQIGDVSVSGRLTRWRKRKLTDICYRLWAIGSILACLSARFSNRIRNCEWHGSGRVRNRWWRWK